MKLTFARQSPIFTYTEDQFYALCNTGIRECFGEVKFPAILDVRSAEPKQKGFVKITTLDEISTPKQLYISCRGKDYELCREETDLVRKIFPGAKHLWARMTSLDSGEKS